MFSKSGEICAKLLQFHRWVQESSFIVGNNEALMLLMLYEPPCNIAVAHFLFHSQSICLILIHPLLQLIMELWQHAWVPDKWRHSGHIGNVRLKCQLSIQTWLIRGSLVNYLISAWASFVTAACLPQRRRLPRPPLPNICKTWIFAPLITLY